MLSLLRKFEANQTFSENESWALFRLAAIAEACGWTLLIGGIVCQRYLFNGSAIPVLLAGRVHGLLFLLYALAAIGLYPTLGWSRKKACLALLASIPPYGSLLFEQWAYHKKYFLELRIYQRYATFATLTRRRS